MNYEAKVEKAANLGLDILLKYLEGEELDAQKVKISHCQVQNYHKYLAVQRTTDALKYGIVRDIATDRVELKAMIQKQIPHLSPE